MERKKVGLHKQKWVSSILRELRRASDLRKALRKSEWPCGEGTGLTPSVFLSNSTARREALRGRRRPTRRGAGAGRACAPPVEARAAPGAAEEVPGGSGSFRNGGGRREPACAKGWRRSRWHTASSLCGTRCSAPSPSAGEGLRAGRCWLGDRRDGLVLGVGPRAEVWAWGCRAVWEEARRASASGAGGCTRAEGCCGPGRALLSALWPGAAEFVFTRILGKRSSFCSSWGASAGGWESRQRLRKEELKESACVDPKAVTAGTQ